MPRLRLVYVGSWGLLACHLLLAACKGKTDSTNGGSTGAGGSNASGGSSGFDPSHVTDLDAFLEAEGEGFCTRLFRCAEGNDDFSSERLVLKSIAGCKDTLARVNANSRLMADLRAQIRTGNIHYDPTNGQQCLKELAACNGAGSIGDGACREAFDGNAKTGEACQRSEDCSGNAYCSGSSSANSCLGTCTPRKPEGETCLDDDECAYAAGAVFCDNSGTTGVCHTLTASPKSAEGEPCIRRLEGADSLELCQDRFWCAALPGGDPNADVLGRCTLPIATGSPCADEDDFCSDGWCDTDTNTCRSLTLVSQAGAACNKDELVVCDPTLGLRCNTAGTCDDSGDGSEGSACFTGDLQRGCDAGLYCAKPAQATSADPGTCRALQAEAASCESAEQCVSGNCKDGACGARPCTL